MVVGQFLDWIESATPARRAEAARALARAYLLAPHDAGHRGAMEAALTLLLDDARSDVKQALAEVFADSDRAPRHVVAALAADQASIATVILGRSPLFIDAELIDLVATAAAPLRNAIASRPRLSAGVAAAIAEVGDAELCLALLANSDAAIAPAAYARIAERLGTDAVVREALLARPDLPPGVHQTLVKRVADALGALVVGKSWATGARTAVVIREACDRATVAIAGEADAAALPALVEHLRASGQLTTALVLRAVCAGNIDFFEAALASLASVPIERVVSLVMARRAGALRAIYAKAGLPAVAFDAFAAALGAWGEVADEAHDPHNYRTPGDVADSILARYTAPADGEGRELAAMLRRFAADQARDAAHEYLRSPAAA